MNNAGQAFGGLIGMIVTAGMVVYIVIPAWIGIGTQRSPQSGDIMRPDHWVQWFGANLSRMGGDLGVTFYRDRLQGPVAGSAGQGNGWQFLPQKYTPGAAPRRPVVQSGMEVEGQQPQQQPQVQEQGDQFTSFEEMPAAAESQQPQQQEQ